MITSQVLISAGINPTAAKLHAPFLDAACERFGIKSMSQQACFLGQAAHETSHNGAGLTAFEENLYYSRPERVLQIFSTRVHSLEEASRLTRNPQGLANRVYSNRYGNGDEASGDGWRYRGRGAGHLTFKDNYAGAEAALGRPYVAQPELVAEPEDAALTFAWFFSSKGCLAPAEAWDVDGVTRKINPGMAGALERRQWCDAFMAAMRRYP